MKCSRGVKKLNGKMDDTQLRAEVIALASAQAKTDRQSFLQTRMPLSYENRDHVANYEKRTEPLQYQLPLSPQGNLAKAPGRDESGRPKVTTLMAG